MRTTVNTMTFLLAFLIVSAVLVAAPRFGRDSRPVFDERPESWRFGSLR